VKLESAVSHLARGQSWTSVKSKPRSEGKSNVKTRVNHHHHHYISTDDDDHLLPEVHQPLIHDVSRITTDRRNIDCLTVLPAPLQ